MKLYTHTDEHEDTHIYINRYHYNGKNCENKGLICFMLILLIPINQQKVAIFSFNRLFIYFTKISHITAQFHYEQEY